MPGWKKKNAIVKSAEKDLVNSFLSWENKKKGCEPVTKPILAWPTRRNLGPLLRLAFARRTLQSVRKVLHRT
jgi:hypothetical protein